MRPRSDASYYRRRSLIYALIGSAIVSILIAIVIRMAS
jgi:hypothetical protein